MSAETEKQRKLFICNCISCMFLIQVATFQVLTEFPQIKVKFSLIWCLCYTYNFTVLLLYKILLSPPFPVFHT
jgi:hypothetical protein